MGAVEERLEVRRRDHQRLSVRLASLSDEDLSVLLVDASSWRANVHGNQSGVVEIDGAKVFVKHLALTDMEREAGEVGTTANLFGLPHFYQYGVGSSGFGLARELQATLRAGGWALSGACPYFPLVYHWRVIRRPGRPEFSDQQRAWMQRAPGYWESAAVGERLDAIVAASHAVVLFLEYAPEMLQAWLKPRRADPTSKTAILSLHDQLQQAAAFMNGQGMLHFDLHAQNVLTDGAQIYVADFGLALCDDFDLTPEERAFFETHRLYDRAYIAWNFSNALKPNDGEPGLGPGLRALVDKAAPTARIFGTFIDALADVSKLTPYPAAELEAALARL